MLRRVSPPGSLPPILIADDEPDSVLLLRGLLKNAGVDRPIVPFHTGQSLLAFLEHNAPTAATVLFLDLGLPDLSGFDVLTRIRKRDALRNLKVVIVSNDDANGAIERAYQAGADAYQIKFPTAETLAMLVASPRTAAPPRS